MYTVIYVTAEWPGSKYARGNNQKGKHGHPDYTHIGPTLERILKIG